MTAQEPERPLLRVVKGSPTPEELAALLAVVTARASAPTGPDPAPAASPWADRAAGLRRAVPIGSGAWARSGRQPGVRTRADW